MTTDPKSTDLPSILDSRRQFTHKLVTLITVLSVAVVALVIAVAAALISLASNNTSRQAAQQGKTTANCVNTALGNRAPLSGDDTQSQLNFLEGLAKSVQSNFTDTTDSAAFLQDIQAREAVLKNLAAYRAAHPLGAC